MPPGECSCGRDAQIEKLIGLFDECVMMVQSELLAVLDRDRPPGPVAFFALVELASRFARADLHRYFSTPHAERLSLCLSEMGRCFEPPPKR